MRLRIFTEPQQGASYTDLLSVAQAAERLGFDAFFRSDHWLKMGTVVDGLPGPSDAWITLAGIARETSRIRLGTLVNAATFRHPGVLAISVANVDHMSNGRVELGLGAGWFDQEHQAYGIPFPNLGDRFSILGEQLAVIDGLWRTADGQTFSYAGKHYTLTDSPALPKPVQNPPPIIIGGGGKTKTPALAARYAAEFNLPFVPSAFFTEQCNRVRSACEAIDRDPNSLRYSVAQIICCGEHDQDVGRRAAVIGRDVDELKANGLCGTPGEIIDRIASWKTLGAETMYLQVLDLADIDHLELIAAEVLPHV
jgi:F420-dependent oxidoreductase-like protein